MKRYALCIGNNNYQESLGLQALQYAVADAEAVSEKLKELGFEVDFMHDLDSKNLAHEINCFTDKLDDYDSVLLYYSGHGFQIDGDNVLVPIDFDRSVGKKDALFLTYPLESLMKWLNDVPEKAKIIILDACREDYSSRGLGDYFVPMSAPPGALIAFSTSPKQKAIERNGHGLYTQCLLNHLDDVRISIEEMFKRVRKELAIETNGRQISWEHTSLIDDFMLKRNSIYDGMNYSDEAFADGNYTFSRDSQVAELVELLKSHNYYIQRDAIPKIRSIDFNTVLADDLFVLGRNIYQAACGGCNACVSYICNYVNEKSIPEDAKEHILCGMAFEIYYDHTGKLRKNYKNEYASEVISILESTSYLYSREFISSRLYDEDREFFYIPGQDDKVDIKVIVEELDNNLLVKDIIFKGCSIISNFSIYEQPKFDVLKDNEELRAAVTNYSFEVSLQKKLLVSSGYLRVTYEGGEVENKRLIIPAFGYNVSLYSQSSDSEED